MKTKGQEFSLLQGQCESNPPLQWEQVHNSEGLLLLRHRIY